MQCGLGDRQRARFGDLLFRFSLFHSNFKSPFPTCPFLNVKLVFLCFLPADTHLLCLSHSLGLVDRLPEGQRGVLERALPHRSVSSPRPRLPPRRHPRTQGRAQALHRSQVHCHKHKHLWINHHLSRLLY